MNHLHYPVQLGSGNAVRVTLDSQANVLLMDDYNYRQYCSGNRFEYIGGLAKRSPMILRAASTGSYHVVIDLGGYAGEVRAHVSVI